LTLDSGYKIAETPGFESTTKLDLIESSDKGRRINPRRFDDLIEQVASQPPEAHVIVDMVCLICRRTICLVRRISRD
jgi:hypothetical protein